MVSVVWKDPRTVRAPMLSESCRNPLPEPTIARAKQRQHGALTALDALGEHYSADTVQRHLREQTALLGEHIAETTFAPEGDDLDLQTATQHETGAVFALSQVRYGNANPAELRARLATIDAQTETGVRQLGTIGLVQLDEKSPIEIGAALRNLTTAIESHEDERQAYQAALTHAFGEVELGETDETIEHAAGKLTISLNQLLSTIPDQESVAIFHQLCDLHDPGSEAKRYLAISPLLSVVAHIPEKIIQQRLNGIATGLPKNIWRHVIREAVSRSPRAHRGTVCDRVMTLAVTQPDAVQAAMYAALARFAPRYSARLFHDRMLTTIFEHASMIQSPRERLQALTAITIAAPLSSLNTLRHMLIHEISRIDNHNDIAAGLNSVLDKKLTYSEFQALTSVITQVKRVGTRTQLINSMSNLREVLHIPDDDPQRNHNLHAVHLALLALGHELRPSDSATLIGNLLLQPFPQPAPFGGTHLGHDFRSAIALAMPNRRRASEFIQSIAAAAVAQQSPDIADIYARLCAVAHGGGHDQNASALVIALNRLASPALRPSVAPVLLKHIRGIHVPAERLAALTSIAHSFASGGAESDTHELQAVAEALHREIIDWHDTASAAKVFKRHARHIADSDHAIRDAQLYGEIADLIRDSDTRTVALKALTEPTSGVVDALTPILALFRFSATTTDG